MLRLSFNDVVRQAHMGFQRQGLSLVLEQIEGFEPLQTAPVAVPAMDGSLIDPSTGGIKGKRPSKKDKLRAAAARGQ